MSFGTRKEFDDPVKVNKKCKELIVNGFTEKVHRNLKDNKIKF